MNITVIVGALGAYFSTWKMISCRTASVPDMFVFVIWFSPRAIHGASITNMKWDLRLKNLDNMVTVGHSDTVIFPWEVSLVKESGKLNLVLSTDLNVCWAAQQKEKKKKSLRLRF